MARNRAAVDREIKRDEIVAAAARLFAADGFDSTSMAAVARAASVAPNTIYWYFDDKDAVLVAVLGQLLEAWLPEEIDARNLPLVDVLLTITERFDSIDLLIAAVHGRAQVSPSVQAWHDAFHAGADAWLLDRIRRHLTARTHGTPPSDAAFAAIPRLWTYAIEGMVAHGLPAAERRELCAALVKQLDAL